ncbi:MAG: extracellular solute-binding protein [Firmicutes bacterium]|nr:extracellular solute-binding protein [Bacillota bacterium]
MTRSKTLALSAAGLLGTAALAGCGAVNTVSPAHASANVSAHGVITVQLQANTGPASSSQNRMLVEITRQWERQHPGVTIKFLDNPYTTVTQSNAALITEASAGKAPDIVWEQYGTVTSGAIPAGILTNLMPYLKKPNPYVKGNREWLDLWEPVAQAYMVVGQKAYVLLGSDLGTTIFYNKADFQKAHISQPPKTWQQFVVDLKKLKNAGITPFMFTDATGGCNPSWFERKFSSELLHSEVNKIDINHAQVADGLDTAVAIERNIISMTNPAYAAGWKLLGAVRPYLAPGASSVSACANVTANAAPESQLIPFAQGKYAMVWSGTWHVPDLKSLGFSGKYGEFPFPEITKASTKYSANISVNGVVGGPNGVGEWSLTTERANSNLTPALQKAAINYLQYLYAPQNEGRWVAGAGNGAFVPVIKGAAGTTSSAQQFENSHPPVVIDGVLDGQLGASAQTDAVHILQQYLSSSISWNIFAQEWDAMLKQAAQEWALTNHVNLSKYVH